MRSLATLSTTERSNLAAQAMLLQAFVDREKIDGGALASAALHARIIALDRWTREQDPNKQSNAEAVIDAAAFCRLTETESGLGFDPIGFSEMVLFVEELPF